MYRTSYDTGTKQHWLSVYRQKLLGRFLLRDTSMKKSQTFAQIESSEQEIRRVVDQMIATLSEADSRRKGASRV